MNLTKFKKIKKSLVSCILGSSLLLGMEGANKSARAYFTEEFVQQKKQQYRDCPFILKVLEQSLNIAKMANFRPLDANPIYGSLDDAIYRLHLSINEYEEWKMAEKSELASDEPYHSKYINIFVCIKNVITHIFVSAFDKYKNFTETSNSNVPEKLLDIAKLDCPIDRGLAFINYVFEKNIIDASKEQYLLDEILERAQDEEY